MEHYRLRKSAAFAEAARTRRAPRGRAARQAEALLYNATGAPVERHLIYEALEEGPSTRPPQKFCDVLGYACRNTHLKHYLHFYDALVFRYIRAMVPNAKEEFRALRQIKKGF